MGMLYLYDVYTRWIVYYPVTQKIYKIWDGLYLHGILGRINICPLCKEIVYRMVWVYSSLTMPIVK